MDTLQVDSPEALACDGQRGEISDGTYIYSSIAENVAVLIGFSVSQCLVLLVISCLSTLILGIFLCTTS